MAGKKQKKKTEKKPKSTRVGWRRPRKMSRSPRAAEEVVIEAAGKAAGVGNWGLEAKSESRATWGSRNEQDWVNKLSIY